MIPYETVTKILDTAQIVEVVGDFVSLRKRGANYIARCPFHNEKTPSFYVSPSKGIYKCFGCGKSGTAIGFVMEHENLSYPEALKWLARKYGIEVVDKEESAEEIAARQRNESLLLVSEYAKDFFAENLNSAEGRALGYAYFKSRGLEDQTIQKYGLGWAPRERNVFLNNARTKGFKEEFLVDSGLCIRHDNGSLVDRFFERAMFPIHSVSGRVIAFGGRTLKNDKTVAKYVNSPETEIYDKSRSLYGIYFAKSEISKQDKCYLVEGYLDVLTLHQLGITNVVASSGTSLTIPQIRLIHKFTDNVCIMYDGDSAGIHAALRGIGLILKEGLNVKIVLLPDGDDPDSFSRKHSLEEVKEFISKNEQDFIAFKTDLLLDEIGNDPLKRADLINDIADTIALIPDPIKRQVYAQSSSEKFNIDSQILFERIRKSHEKEKIQDSGPRNIEKPAAEPKPTTTPTQYFEDPILQPAERDLLWFILNHGIDALNFESDSDFYDPDYSYTVADFIRCAMEEDNHEFVNTIYRNTYNAWFAFYDSDASLVQQEINKALMNGEDRTVADLVAEMTQERYQLTVSNFAAAMTATATKLVMFVPRAILVYQAARLERQNKELLARLKENPEEAEDILEKIQKISRLRNVIEAKLGRYLIIDKKNK